MFFESAKRAKEYAKDQTQATRRKHKAVSCRQWVFCRESGEYNLEPRWTVVLA